MTPVERAERVALEVVQECCYAYWDEAVVIIAAEIRAAEDAAVVAMYQELFGEFLVDGQKHPTAVAEIGDCLGIVLDIVRRNAASAEREGCADLARSMKGPKAVAIETAIRARGGQTTKDV